MRLFSYVRWGLSIALCVILVIFGHASIAATADNLSWPTVQLQVVTEGLQQPVHMAYAPDDSGRLFVLEQEGYIRIVQQNTLQAEPFLDLSEQVSCCRELGLLGLAFPPDYANKGHFYVFYTRREDNTGVLARYGLLQANQADPQSGEI